MRRIRTIVLGAAIAVGGWETEARAQEASDFEANVTQQRAGVEIDWWSAKNLGSMFDVVPFAQFRLSDTLFLQLQLPFGSLVNGPDDKTRFTLGNPTVGVHYAKAASPTLTWFVGGRASLPVETFNDDTNTQLVGIIGAYTQVLYNLFLWAPNSLPIGAYGGVEAKVSPAVFVRGELAPTLYIPIGKNKGDTELVYSLRGEVEGRSASGWGGGGGLVIVHSLPDPIASSKRVGDNAQGTLDLFGAYTTPGAFFARLGMFFPLDSPLGAGLDKGKVLTFYTVLGTRF